MRMKDSVAFSMPGGETSGPAGGRPIDLVHLGRQTMGDRSLEQEVLALFIQQVVSVRDRIADASVQERLLMAHGLKGSARGVGAFAIADCATAIERQPEDARNFRRLASLLDDLRDFIASISR